MQSWLATYVNLEGAAAHITTCDPEPEPEGAVHQFTASEFSAWLDGAKKGEFDHLAG